LNEAENKKKTPKQSHGEPQLALGALALQTLDV